MKIPQWAVRKIPASIPFLIGIIAGIFCFDVMGTAAGWIALPLAGLWLRFRRSDPAAMILLGALAGGVSAWLQMPDWPAELQSAAGKGVRLAAEIRIADPGVSAVPDLPEPGLIFAELREIRLYGEETPLHDTMVPVLIRVPRKGFPRLRSGVVFAGEGILEGAAAEVFYTDPDGKIRQVKAPDESFQHYWKRKGAAGIMYLTRGNGFRYEPRWRDHLSNLRDFLAERLLQGVEDVRIRREMASLFLGCRFAAPAEERMQWVRSGTIHLFSVSGMHVGVLAGVLLWLMRGIPFRTRHILLPVMLLGYVLAAGANVPAVRAWGMVAAWSWLRAGLFWMPNIQVLLWTAAVLLLWNPANRTDMGFLYSFVITGTLLLLAERCREAKWMRDPLDWMPESPEKTRFRRILHWRNRILCAILACGAAFLAGSVITLHFQGMFPMISVAANLVLLPVIALIFPLALAKIAVGGIFPGEWLGVLLEGCWKVLHGVTAAASAIGPSGAVAPPAWWEIGLFYAALAGILLPEIPRKWRISAAGVWGC